MLVRTCSARSLRTMATNSGELCGETGAERHFVQACYELALASLARAANLMYYWPLLVVTDGCGCGRLLCSVACSILGNQIGTWRSVSQSVTAGFRLFSLCVLHRFRQRHSKWCREQPCGNP